MNILAVVIIKYYSNHSFFFNFFTCTHLYSPVVCAWGTTMQGIMNQLDHRQIVGVREEPRISEQQFGNFQCYEEVQKAKQGTGVGGGGRVNFLMKPLSLIVSSFVCSPINHFFTFLISLLPVTTFIYGHNQI